MGLQLLNVENFQLQGAHCTEFWFRAPLSYASCKSVGHQQITVFVRKISSSEKNECASDMPYLLFLQGGPGFEALRPTLLSGWLKYALQFYTVILLDQRGTGLSSPITSQSIANISTDPLVQADYLKHFRADSIVLDAEAVRAYFIKDKPWSILGQSFGGFCAVHYLSTFPKSLKEVFITGGLPPSVCEVDSIYASLFTNVRQANEAYYKRYPQDVVRVCSIVEALKMHPILLPNGGQLTVRRFQQLGMLFGGSGGFETLHFLLLEAFDKPVVGKQVFSMKFKEEIQRLLHFESNPLYAVLHEAIYCQGTASNWSAERVSNEQHSFSMENRPFYFTGEMIFRWMFDDYALLRPLKDAANLLAKFHDWPALYNWNQLENNTVPCAAVIYYDDMYVDRFLSEQTARRIKNCKTWITNEFVHSGLRDEGAEIFARLRKMVFDSSMSH